ncbi:hypothetical protein R3P38DRAFT_3196064 [Favolaschia claudopus]|uniref:Uncharacterized protein n=1 Tax=Favolaschia claudopus TaxID=2862362 RepID=A0AAW0BA13_9AGAR
MNSFGLYREYPRVPTHDPDGTISLEDLSDIPKPASAATTAPPPQIPTALAPSSRPESSSNPYHPFPNSTAYGITNWMWSGSPMKSMEEGIKLLEFLKSDAFRKEDVADLNLVKETQRLDQYTASGGDGTTGRDGWKEVSVDIQVPDGKPHPPNGSSPIPLYTVPGLFLRPLSEVIRSAILNGISRRFHFTPFRQFHKTDPNATPTRVYDEIYSSEAMIAAYEKLQSQPREPDSTHLASFGSAALWPLYLLFGNQSKWVRGKPRANACHHTAYIPKLPDEFHDWYTAATGEGPSAEVLAHCRRELMHAVWAKILDDDFMDIYEHGIVIECHDGISRRFYPRFFTYSADYPEKVLLTGIRNLGACPCPRCKIPKDKISGLGTKNDDKARTRDERKDDTSYRAKIASARRHIYELGKGIKSAVVERILSPQSLVPTLNTLLGTILQVRIQFLQNVRPRLSSRVRDRSFKSVFTHLIRILVAHGGTAVQTLNARLITSRDIEWSLPLDAPSSDVSVQHASAMKKMAARRHNFEDLLQCALPRFRESSPGAAQQDHSRSFVQLGRMARPREAADAHDSLLTRLSEVTSRLGQSLRYFAKHTCAHFDTRELPKEEAARGRRNARKNKSRPTPVRQQAAAGAASKKKLFNLDTYKLHSLGDYIHYIPFIGTSDSWSTQTGELEHRRVKRFYARTNKNTAVRQMTVLERLEQALARIARTLGKILPPPSPPPVTSTKPRKKKARKPLLSLDFAESDIPHFLSDNRRDPATHNFLPKLKDHILSRLAHPDESGDDQYSAEEHRSLLISSDRLYRHKILRVNYTTYDVRQGVIPRTHFRTLASSASSTLMSSTNVAGASKVPTTVEVLWVRRFQRDTSYRAGFKAKRLHRLQFLPGDDPMAFDLLQRLPLESGDDDDEWEFMDEEGGPGMALCRAGK